MSSDKYRLNWKEFEDNTKGYFREVRVNEEFSDVTLACEDGQQIDAHKIVLSACSPFFRALLRRNQHQHPLIYMRGMTSNELSSLLDFMYYGEIEISQEDLSDFLAVAEELKLRGLTPEKNNGTSDTPSQFVTPTRKKRKQENSPTPTKRPTIGGTPEQFVCEPETTLALNSSMDNMDSEVEEISPPHYDGPFIGHGEPEENMDSSPMIELDRSFDPEKAKEAVAALEDKIQSMVNKNDDGSWNCKVCGKIVTGRQAKGNMKQHAETHLEGIQHTCTTCGKTYKNRNSLHTHISMKHRSILDGTNVTTVRAIVNQSMAITR